MIKLSFYFLLFLVFSFKVTAQKLGLNKVTKSELLEKRHKIDTAAPAAFLLKNARTEFVYSQKDGFTPTTTFQVKVKIYNNQGLKWANFKIPYYIGFDNLDDDKVDIINGYTYNLEGDKIIKSKVTGEGKFRENINENWALKSVTFPNVKAGSIIELEYRLKSQYLWMLPEFKYQYEIPVNSAFYKTEVPEYYIYNAIRKGYVEVESSQKLESKTQSYERKADYHSESVSLNFKQIVTDFTVNNVPALKEEDYVNNINNYYGTIEHELKLIRYPDQPVKQIATTWEAVAKTIFEEEDFKTAINSFDYFLSDLRLVINSAATPEENIKKVFNFVKNRMNFNGKYGYYPRTKMNVAYANKVGSVAEINLLLVAMLRMAGFEANPVLVSTRDNGVALFPNRILFNYVIAAVTIDEKTILLDATSKYADQNILPVRDLNTSGRLIKKDGSSADINLMPKSNSKDIINIMATISPQGEVTGKVREQYFDYNAFIFRENNNNIAKNSYIEKLEKRYQGLEIGEYDVQNKNDLSLPIVENYDFKATNSVEIIGDKMYFSPFLFFGAKENPFKQETREYPIDFVYPNQDKYLISITIPEGYAVEVLPKGASISMPENMGDLKYSISNTANQIQVLCTLDINQAIIGSEYYEILKGFYKEIVNKQTEKIVLKKV